MNEQTNGRQSAAGQRELAEKKRRSETVVVRATDLDIEQIQEAIRQRIDRRSTAVAVGSEAELDEERAALLERLGDPYLVREIWDRMWPPTQQPWNVDQPYPIRSHRGGIGGLLVLLKRAQRVVKLAKRTRLLE